MQKDFPWGEVIKVHSIGEYTITEFKPDSVFNSANETEFSTGHAYYDTLDEAIIGAICSKYEEPAAEYWIWKMLK